MKIGCIAGSRADSECDLSAIPLLQNLRGDFFCLPFGGNGDPVDGKQYPPHGETAAYRWQLAKAEETGDKTVFEFEMNCSVSGAKVVKRIEMQNGTDALYLAHTISNLEGKMPYGHHTIIQMPEESIRRKRAAEEQDKFLSSILREGA